MAPIAGDWQEALKGEFHRPYYAKLYKTVMTEYKTRKIFPPPEDPTKAICSPGFPSLVNIYKELEDDMGCYIPNNGNLEKWAKQGVLLLNTVLTVRAHQANSHRGIGWEQFTDAAIRILDEEDRPIVFLLWGRPAQMKASMLHNPRHLILEAPHPSPLSAYRGFFGCKHFSKANEFLKANGEEPIDWQIENI